MSTLIVLGLVLLAAAGVVEVAAALRNRRVSNHLDADITFELDGVAVSCRCRRFYAKGLPTFEAALDALHQHKLDEEQQP